MSDSIMWVEKYRPQKITDLVNQKEIVGSLTSLLKNVSEIPHLLFSGSAGVGKTTLAICAINGRTQKERHPKFGRPGLQKMKEKMGEKPDQKFPADWGKQAKLPEKFKKK